MKIVIAIMLIVFCVYETVGLVKAIPEWKKQSQLKKQAKAQAEQEKNNTNEVVGDSDSK